MPALTSPSESEKAPHSWFQTQEIMFTKSIPKALLLTLSLAILFWSAGVTQLAQTQSLSRNAHLNDFAGVVDERTRARLENILSNLQQKTGVQFDIATVQSTAGLDIFDFSRQLAREWNVGFTNTRTKSLLLVVSVEQRSAFIQFSRSVQRELPEGLLGEIAQRLRVLVQGDQFSLGISSAVEHFVTALGDRMAFRLEDLDQQTTAKVQPDVVAEATPLPTESSTPAMEPVSGMTRLRKVTPPAVAESMVNKAEPSAALTEEDEDESEEVELTLTLPLAERLTALKEFLDKHPSSKARPRARELLVSTHASLGDSLLSNRDSAGGIEQLMLAIDAAPEASSDKLFSGVVAQIPLNLYLRNEREAAFQAAYAIEQKFANNSHRLLALASFHLGIERGDEAVRLASKALSLTPDLGEAHYSLGMAYHILLRLEDAIASYRKALELDPKLTVARRSLADLSRGIGKAEEALTLYREQLTSNPDDKLARAGLVLSLLDTGRTEEGEKELEAALTDDPRNVSLLSGAAYWFAAHDNSARALELATRAVEIEPRYTWSQIALARALLGQRRPLEAERAIRLARQYGKFPTLDYELASVLVSLGLFEEAAEILPQSFQLNSGQLETRLAGRTLAQADNFIDLLAAERRGSFFQFQAAENEPTARTVKELIAFSNALAQEDEGEMVAAAKRFAEGTDSMRTFRAVYAASRLLRVNKGLDSIRELLETARSGVDEALNIPALTVAVQADELREFRFRAISSGGTADIPEAPQNVLSNLLRGRIEDLTGWVLFNQDQPNEALVHLNRATGVLPEGTPAWRTAVWHLGATHEVLGNKEDALNAYIKSYLSGERDAARRALIERLYVQVNGSSEGLDQRIGGVPGDTTSTASPSPGDYPQTATSGTAATPEPSPLSSPEETASPSNEGTQPESAPKPKESPVPSPSEEVPSPTPASSPSEGESPPVTVESNPSERRSTEPSLSDLPVKAPTSLKLTGRIRDAAGNGIANVVVVLISSRGSVLASTTDEEGRYAFTVSPSERPLRVLPSKEGVTFSPIDKTVIVFSEHRENVDFLAIVNPNP